MTDMLQTIIPKSDQTNADDLIGKTLTIKITKVSIIAGDQPVALSYEGDSGKPYKPGKSMRRVLVNVWGSDGNAYVGRSMTLYRDDKVTFGGLAVGGIRISHMSHIDSSITMVLTASKANKKPFTVNPLPSPKKPSESEDLLKDERQKKLAQYHISIPNESDETGVRDWISYTSSIITMIKGATDLAEFNLMRTANKDGLEFLALSDEKLRSEITEVAEQKYSSLKALAGATE